MAHEISKGSVKTHHFSGELSPYVILSDEKEMAEKIKNMLSDVKQVENRRYNVFKGGFGGKEITVIHTYMTAGNTAIIADQAIQQGARYIFKVGGFGALQDNVKIGDVYLITGAVRSEGLTDAYAPIYYPAVMDFGLAMLFSKAAEKEGLKVGSGITHSVNIYSPYYSETFNARKYSPDIYRSLNVVGVEMEVSSAYICSSVKGAKALAVLVCNRDWETQDKFRKGELVDWRKYQKDGALEASYNKAIKCLFEVIKGLDAEEQGNRR